MRSVGFPNFPDWASCEVCHADVAEILLARKVSDSFKTPIFPMLDCWTPQQRSNAMVPRFSAVCWSSFIICLALALVWSFAPEMLLALWNVEPTQSTILIARRSAPLFLGFAWLTYAMRRAPRSDMRTAVADALALACIGLAGLGLKEYLISHAGAGILSAVCVEVALAIALPLSARAQASDAK